MNEQIVTINLIPGLSAPAVVRVSQYDVGRPLAFKVLDGTNVASLGATVTTTIVGTKPSGLGFSVVGTLDGNIVTVDTTLAMTQECGMISAEIRFTTSTPATVIGTANFTLAVEPSSHPEGTTDGTQETMQNLETRLQGQIDSLDSRVDALEAGGGGSGLTDDVKTALLNCFAHVAWVDADGQDYYDALESALDSGDLSVSLMLSQVSSSNTATTVGYGESYNTTLTASTGYTLNTVTVTMGGVDVTSTTYSSGTVSIPSVTGNIVITATAVLAAQSITATYTQSGTVYDTDSLDSLKPDLVVTANYSGGTSETVPASDYTLSGTLTEGTSTITVSYAGLTTTFNVTVTHEALPWEDGVPYSFTWVENKYIKRDGSEDTYNNWNASPFLNCDGAGHLNIHNGFAKSNNYNAFYDENQTFKSYFAVEVGDNTIAIPSGAVYFRVSYDTTGSGGDRTYTITPTLA